MAVVMRHSILHYSKRNNSALTKSRILEAFSLSKALRFEGRNGENSPHAHLSVIGSPLFGKVTWSYNGDQ